MTSISDYCSTISREATEPLWGTARHAERWLLIEYQAAWPAKVLKSGLLPDALMRQLDSLQQAFPGFHTLFVRQGYTRSGPLRAFLIDCREGVASIQRLEFDDYEELASMDLAGYLAGRQHGVSEAALYLVCTHGTHDKCCAKFGLPVHAALSARHPDRVWEASHLGGHRFAANMICFPTGVLYGRVTPEIAPRLIESDARGELDLSHYRGRFALAPPVQAAEYFIRTQLSLPRIADLRQDRCTQIDRDHWSVSFRADGTDLVHQAIVELSGEPLQVLKDCEASALEPVRAFVLADYRIGEAQI
jgi:hypothetical protein